EGNRTFRAVYHIKGRQLVQLADTELAETAVSGKGDWALGWDDRPYRVLVGYDANYADHYLVNLASGARKPLLRKVEGPVTWSGDAKSLLHFNGKDWNSLSVPDGKLTNLTAKLGVQFAQEDYDSPGTAPPYGSAGWTTDDRHVLLYD